MEEGEDSVAVVGPVAVGEDSVAVVGPAAVGEDRSSEGWPLHMVSVAHLGGKDRGNRLVQKSSVTQFIDDTYALTEHNVEAVEVAIPVDTVQDSCKASHGHFGA